MNSRIREEYFTWLYSQVFRIRDLDSPYSYVYLCHAMHSVPFNDSVPNDHNREAQGRELRDEFISTLKKPISMEDYARMKDLGKASVFEMLIGLARRAEFMIEHGVPWWFMLFLTNLGLNHLSDDRYIPRDNFMVRRVLRIFNERRYTRTGRGGLFPLQEAEEDQRQVELWFQMAAFMNENKMY